MAINPSFKGHGTFCYLADATMRYYANYPQSPALESTVSEIWNLARETVAAPPAPPSPDGFVKAVKDMGISHVWVRLFGLEGAMPEAPTRTLINALRGAHINVAGWGYCHGRNWASERDLAIRQSDLYDLDAFVADIEPSRDLGGTRSKWSTADLDNFINGLFVRFGKDNLAVSTWPVLRIQDTAEYPSLALMKQIADRVGVFAPQAYWMSYPKQVHYGRTGFSTRDYPPNDPASFVRLVVDSWRSVGFTNPILVTGQAYWGENSPPRATMEAKIATFASSFTEWQKITGFNWWHAGGSSAMSRLMIQAIINGSIGTKPFHRP